MARGDLGPSEIGEFFARLFFWDFLNYYTPPVVVRLLHPPVVVRLLPPPPVVVRLLHPPVVVPLFWFFFQFFFCEKLTLVVTPSSGGTFFFWYRDLQGDPQNNLAESECA